MSKKTEICNSGSVLETSAHKVKKKKHNSKRRKSKRDQKISDISNDSKISELDKVINFLCDTITKNESETSVEMKPINTSRQSSIDTKTECNQKQNSKCPIAASDLNDLFKNLQVHTSSNPIKSNNITEFLNIDLLKKSDCRSLSIEDFEKKKQEKIKKFSNKNKGQDDIPKDKLQEYFNLSLIKQNPTNSIMEKTGSTSMILVSELEETFHSNLSEISETLESRHLTECLKVEDLKKVNDFLATSNNSAPKFFIDEFRKTVLEEEELKKYNRRRKYGNKKKKETGSDFVDFNEEIEENHPLLNSTSIEKNDLINSSLNSPQKTLKNKKKQQVLKSSCSQVNDLKFPDYLSSEELQSVSNYGVLLCGIIRINQKNYKEAYITAPDKGMDILIEGLKDRNRALEGDEVYFVLKPKEHYRTNVDSTDVQRTAVVVAIKTLNHNRGAIGSLNVIRNKNVNFALFSPRDSRLPRIRIKKNNWPLGFSENSDNFKNKLYFAKISQWRDLRYADGEIIKEVGIAGDIAAETDALLLKNELDTTPYSEVLKQFIPPSSYKISETEIKRREDLRRECIFTIDPATAVDLDDAVSCRRLSNGNYEIGVHISDVSYYLTEGTPLDLAVSKRATTIYLVQKTYHMLPHELCRLCSLTPGQDKLSFSVLWEVTPDFKIVNHRFARTVMNSCAQFSYDQVQSIIISNSLNECTFPKIHGLHSLEKIREAILFLYKMAMNLKCKRFSNGALKIDQTKICFSLNENLLPVEFKVEVHEESHQLIEELMLLANITVAEKLSICFPTIAFLRCHSPPLSYMLEKVQKTLEKYGIILNISSPATLQASLLNYSGDDTESMARMLVLNNVIAKPMARARYYCAGNFPHEDDRRHYALNVPLYTHFTSPIRRYADVVVHRLLAASLNYIEPPKWSTDYVQGIASNCNKQKYAAKIAGEMSSELFLAVYIGLKGVFVCEAVVSDIKDKSFDCIGLSTGAHQRVYFEHIKGELHQEKIDGISRLTIKWPKDETHEKETIQIIEMFSIVKVELRRVNTLKIEAKLLRYDG